MTGCLTKGEGQWAYHLHIDDRKKSYRIYWRNHGQSYIKQNGIWTRVYFNRSVLDSGSYGSIPVRMNAEGEWEMVHEYMELPDRSYVMQAAD